MDLCDEAFSRSLGQSSSGSGSAGSSRDSDSADEVKSCAGCQTTKTPLWRGGPTGPKSLCNACGIRYSKNRRTSFGPKEGGNDGEKKQKQRPSAVVVVNHGSGLEVSLKLRMLGLGSDVQRSMIQKQRRMMMRNRRFGEVERAAKLLMALSSGVLYA